jgi:SAM-dependent methyltransferase
MPLADSKRERRRLSFGSIAERYNRARPSFPSELIDAVIAYAPAGPLRAVEVGAGTGKATVLFAARGVEIHAVEPDREMVAVLERNVAEFPNVTIEHAEFESAAVPAGDAGLVYAAQSWHWVAPELRYALARRALADGGALAAFWNRPRWSMCTMRDELLGAYERTGTKPEDHGPQYPSLDTALDLGEFWQPQIAESDGFGDSVTHMYSWTETYTTSHYVELLGTCSDHVVLNDDVRSALLAEIAAVIDAHGGTFELPYSTLLCLARAV